MRIWVGAGLLAATFMVPHAAAQTDAYPLLDHTPTLSATLTTSDDTVTAGRVHARYMSSMGDFYPAGDDSGFHVSAGLGLFERRSMLRQNLEEMRDLVYLPYTRSNSGVHWGYRRVATIAAGYTQPIDDNVSLGIEAGAMMGRALSRGGRRMGLRRLADGDGPHSGPNPVVHLVLDVNF